MSQRSTLVEQVLLYFRQVHFLGGPSYEVLRVLYKLRQARRSHIAMNILCAVRLRRLVAAVHELLLELIQPVLLVASAFVHAAALRVGALRVV